MTSRISNEELTQIRERAEKATKGEWAFVPIVDSLEYFIVGENGEEAVASEVFMLNDAVFIAHAREDIPKLLAEIERLKSQNESLVRFLHAEGYVDDSEDIDDDCFGEYPKEG